MIRRTFLISGATILAGCSILPERPPLKYFGLNVGQPPADCISERFLSSSIRVNMPSVAAPFNTPKIYIKGKDNRFYPTDINRLVAPPNELIGDALRQWIQTTGPWKTVLSPNTLATPDFQMTVYISDLYANTSISAPGGFYIAMEVSVTRSSDDKLVFHKNYNLETPIKDQTMVSVVESYVAGLRQIFTLLSKDLNHTFIRR